MIDRAVVLRRVGGDMELLTELVELFLDSCPERLSQVREAIEQADSAALERAAHALKGVVSNFSVGDTFEAALRLEEIGRTGDLAHAEEARQALEEALERLKTALALLGKEEARGG